MPNISAVHARQILDSRGNPTVEVEVTLDDRWMGRAAVPSGASTGSREVLELRDGGDAYLGKAVMNAVNNVKGEIGREIVGKDWSQQSLDDHLIKLDGTPTKSRLGANAILGVSMAFAVASAQAANRPLYEHLGSLAGNNNYRLPKPILNVLNGGAHANWTTDIQEYILFPMKAEPYHEQLRKSAEVFHHLGKIIAKRDLSTNVGNEGGYAPQFSSNQDGFDFIMEAVEKAGYTMGRDGDFMMGIDGAATEFYQDGKYNLKRDKITKTTDEMVAWMVELCEKYPICSLEDALAEDDWEGWTQLTAKLGDKVNIVGDDLTVTNPQYVQQAIDQKSCNAAIIKLNQVGSVTETLRAMQMVREAGWTNIVAHRSGETEDTFIAHLAVGAGGQQIKTGAPSRTDRTAKYNELLRIEERL